MSENEETAGQVETTPTNESGESSAETQNTGAESDESVPKSRFNEIAARARVAEKEARELRERMQELEERQSQPKTRQEQPDASDDPKDDVEKQLQQYVERFGKRFIERELGMTLSDAKTLLATSKSTSENYARQVWESECAKHGLDPTSDEVQELAQGFLANRKRSIADAVGMVAKYVNPRPNGAQQQTPPKPTANVETGGLAGVATTSDALPWNAREAAEMASKGIKAKHLSTEEIIRRRLDAAKK